MNCRALNDRRPALLSTLLLCNLSVGVSTLFSPTAKAADPKPLLVAAASDLMRAASDLGGAFERKTGIKVRFVTAASGLLARQIEQGAPYDAYLSANQAFVSSLAAAGGLVGDSVRVYARGRLGLWARGGGVTTLEALAEPWVRHVAMANPVHAPYGRAARELLESKGLWSKLEPKVVYAENVRQALEYAASGNAEAVITAWALVYDNKGVLLSDTGYKPILQAGGIVARSARRGEAGRFLEFLTGPEGRAILVSHGFSPPQ